MSIYDLNSPLGRLGPSLIRRALGCLGSFEDSKIAYVINWSVFNFQTKMPKKVNCRVRNFAKRLKLLY